MKLSTYLCCRG